MAKKKTDFSFEGKLLQIKQIAERMQNGNLHLEENMALFKEADQLIAECRTYLQQAAVQVEQLVNPQSDERTPFV
ncbi:MAG: exodeoxyribonuclease VII small subunit [Sphingobacteriaceae bacterium]|nr:exodeoxyribonuclease VII small subunit [Sphingobacteriaceae bacterium]